MPATTKTFRYVCSHDMRAENPLHLRLTQLFEPVRQETAGGLEVEIVPWGGTGPSKVTLTKLLEGEIQSDRHFGLRGAAQRQRLLSALAQGVRRARLDAAGARTRPHAALTPLYIASGSCIALLQRQRASISVVNPVLEKPRPLLRTWFFFSDDYLSLFSECRHDEQQQQHPRRHHEAAADGSGKEHRRVALR